MKALFAAFLVLWCAPAFAQTNIFGNPWEFPTTNPYAPPATVYSPPPVYSFPRTVNCITIPVGNGQTITSCN